MNIHHGRNKVIVVCWILRKSLNNLLQPTFYYLTITYALFIKLDYKNLQLQQKGNIFEMSNAVLRAKSAKRLQKVLTLFYVILGIGECSDRHKSLYLVSSYSCTSILEYIECRITIMSGISLFVVLRDLLLRVACIMERLFSPIIFPLVLLTFTSSLCESLSFFSLRRMAVILLIKRFVYLFLDTTMRNGLLLLQVW